MPGPKPTASATSGWIDVRPLVRAPAFPSDSVAEAADFDDPEAVLSVFGDQEGDVTDRTLLASLRFLPAPVVSFLQGHGEDWPWPRGTPRRGPSRG